MDATRYRRANRSIPPLLRASILPTPRRRTGWANEARKGARIGYDPWLHTPAQVARFTTAVEKAGAELVAVAENPIDILWTDRPAPPHGAVTLHARKYAGEPAEKKLEKIAAALKSDALLVSDPHALAWAFNLRGDDVAHTPIALGFALIFRDGKPELFLEPGKLNKKVAASLGALAKLAPPENLPGRLAELAKADKSLSFDAATAPAKLAQSFTGAGGKLDAAADPIALMKARKNLVELAGARAAHLRDGIALTRFLCWFDAKAAKGKLSEIGAAEALESFRRESGELRDISFPTISAFGPHAALPHYRVTDKSSVTIGKGVLSGRFRRAIFRRHHRRHPHRRRRAREQAGAENQYAGAQGPYRHRPRRVSAWRSGAQLEFLGAAAFCGRRDWISTMASAMASAPICRCMRGRNAFRNWAGTTAGARHDPVQ